MARSGGGERDRCGYDGGVRLVRDRPARYANSERCDCALSSERARLMCALVGGCDCDDSLVLGVGAVSSVSDGVARHGVGSVVTAAAAAGRRLGRNRPARRASSERCGGALGSWRARLTCALDDGCGCDDSLAFGVGAVGSAERWQGAW